MLEKFKTFLDNGTNESLGYDNQYISRYVSFSKSIERLKNKRDAKILELGTTRSYVSGAFEGCNSDDMVYWDKDRIERWDWGAGCFTLLFGLSLPESNIISVDLASSHIKRSKYMSDSLGLTNIKHVISDSVTFLGKLDCQFDLIYLDTGDMWPIEPTAELQLEEAKAIVKKNLLKDDGILLIDDVLNATPNKMGSLYKYGKSELSLPFLNNNGFKTVFAGYQFLLQR